MVGRLGNRVPLNQNILAAEFVLGIAPLRGIAVCLHAVMKIKNLRGIAKRCIDFFFCPNVKRTFGVFPMAGLTAPGYSWTISIFSGKKSAFLGCHIAGDVIENVARDRFELVPSRRVGVRRSTPLPGLHP